MDVAPSHPKVTQFCNGAAQYNGNLFVQSQGSHGIELIPGDAIVVFRICNPPIESVRVQTLVCRFQLSDRFRQQVRRELGVVLKNHHDEFGVQVEILRLVRDLFVFEQERLAQVCRVWGLEHLRPFFQRPRIIRFGDPNPPGAVQSKCFDLCSGAPHRFIDVGCFRALVVGPFEGGDSVFEGGCAHGGMFVRNRNIQEKIGAESTIGKV
mmetsp:Transcript_16503/g.34034  ORF Transcript_16503/g.34034 Transcript_16503/m.34034 type:complete len:209 (-) Transcript_16503:32-658(-)